MSDHSNRHVEQEIKLSIPGEVDYRRLIGHLPEPHTLLLQSNYFFDTPDRQLGARKWALRLRTELHADGSENAFLALKGPGRQVNGVTIRSEIEQRTELASAASIIRSKRLAPEQLGELQTAIGDTMAASFDMVVSFTNRRIASTIEIDQEKLIFEIDATTFQDGNIEYELEVELNAEQSRSRMIFEELKALLKNWNIEYKPDSRTKLEKALLLLK